MLFLVSRHETDPRAAGGDIQGSVYSRYLAEAGHRVTYLTSSYLGAPEREWRDGVEIVRLGRLELLAWRMYRFYRRWGDGFDAVYAEAFGGARVPFLAPLYVKQPVLTAWYQVNRPVFLHQYGRIAGSVLSQMERLVARMHDEAAILTPSEARRADLIDFGFRPEQILVLPPVAVEEGAFAASPVSGDRESLILWLGKIRRYKCVHHVVEAMPTVLGECPAARLVIAGRRDDERYLRELRQRVKRLRIEPSVEFALDISEAAKRDLLARAGVLVVPSPVEGFGIVVLEAGAQGTPAVVSEGVPQEVVTDRYNGIRVPFGDRHRLAEALSLVLSSPQLRGALSRNAMELARGFSKAALMAKLEAALSDAAGGEALAEPSV